MLWFRCCRGPARAMPHAEIVFCAVEGQLEQKAGSPEVARGVYSQREAFLAKREAEGELTFRYVENDGAPDNSIWCACNVLSPSACKAAAATVWDHPCTVLSACGSCPCSSVTCLMLCVGWDSAHIS